jgi:hypothetical protein
MDMESARRVVGVSLSPATSDKLTAVLGEEGQNRQFNGILVMNKSGAKREVSPHRFVVVTSSSITGRPPSEFMPSRDIF